MEEVWKEKVKRITSCFLPIAYCLLLAFSLASCQYSKSPVGLTAQLQRVNSGQTLEVLITSNLIERVRLIGIQAPDLAQQPWGKAAKEELETLLRENNDRQLVLLESDRTEKDRFGRRLAHVWKNEVLVTEKLVARGYALADLEFTHKYSKRLMRAQEYARLMGYGIWNPSQPLRLSPAEFRKQ
jgi:micrococcal nuclease